MSHKSFRVDLEVPEHVSLQVMIYFLQLQIEKAVASLHPDHALANASLNPVISFIPPERTRHDYI